MTTVDSLKVFKLSNVQFGLQATHVYEHASSAKQTATVVLADWILRPSTKTVRRERRVSGSPTRSRVDLKAVLSNQR